MLTGSICVFAGAAHAEPSATDKAFATVLFEQGRALIAEGQVPVACQKFAESQRLDPSGGTLLNLARCHEAQGLLASAWSEFQEARNMAQQAERSDRETESERRISALEPRLSRLIIEVPAAAQLAGLRIEYDGRELGRGAWSTPIPVDGGPHVVLATAPDREPFRWSGDIAAESEVKTVEVPPLSVHVVIPVPIPAPLPAVTTPPEPSLAPRLEDTPRVAGQWRALAYVSGGAGVALAAATLGHYAWNRGRYGDWKSADSSLATEERTAEWRSQALVNNELANSIERASKVTVGLAVASGALLGAAGGLFWLDASERASLHAEAGPAGLGFTLHGTW